MRLRRPIQTRFRYGYPTRVNLATYHNSQAHSSKGTRSLHFSPKAEYAPTACRHTVSGTISRPLTGVLFTFPSRYLFTIGHQGVFRLRRWSSRIHTGFLGPRATWDPFRESLEFRLQGCHLLCRSFPTTSATQAIFYSLPDQQLRLEGPATPNTQRLPAITRTRFGLFPFRSPLLRESRLLYFPVGTEMFHFPTFPPPALSVQAGAMGHNAQSGFPIRKSPDRSLVADSPGLIAGSYVLLRLLVPRHSPCALINLATTDDARVHCAVLKVRAVPVRPAVRRFGPGPVQGSPQMRPCPQDPTACSAWSTLRIRVPCRSALRRQMTVLADQAGVPGPNNQCSTNEQPPRNIRPGYGSGRDIVG